MTAQIGLHAGDRHFFAEEYEDAQRLYQQAVDDGDDSPELAAKLDRASAMVAIALTRGEQTHALFDRLFTRERLLAGPHQGRESTATPPAFEVGPQGVGKVVRRGAVVLGRGIGAVGSFTMRHTTELVGRAGTNGRVWTNWYTSGTRLPGPVGKTVQILKLSHMRETLFANNLVRPYPDGVKTAFFGTSDKPPAAARRWRSADGSWNKLRTDGDGRHDPMVGAAFTRFYRNVGDDLGLAAVVPREDPANNPVSVRDISRAVFAPKGERQLVPFFNLWAGAWIQFMIHGWVSHGQGDPTQTETTPLTEGDPLREAFGLDELEFRRTHPDPTRQPVDGDRPPTFVNEVTHWWDGSQLYGSDPETQAKVRSGVGGKLTVTDEGTLPLDPESGTETTGFSRNWWLCLGALHTLFVLEHNAICDELATAHPDWDDEALFQTARLVNAAVMAKIHTVEWTPAILPNKVLHDGMLANWYGLVTELFGGKRALEDIPITNRELGGIIGNPQATFADFGLSEEFTAVYRMHSLLPDSVKVFPTGSTEPVVDVPLIRTRHAQTAALIAEHGMESVAWSMGTQLSGALVANNYPAALLDISIPGEPVVDLGALDLFRDRERGVPPYNQLRAELSLQRVHSFDDLTDDAALASILRDLYGVDDEGHDRIDDMDLLVGTLCEGHRPPGFGFGETLFQVFLLNASWRLLGDRFFTDDYREDVYTREGLDWIDAVTMKAVLLRHYPGLAETSLGNVSNAFEPWDAGRLDPSRHPLRAFEGHEDPWAGEAAS